ncbi:MAG: hypothetical protein U0166_02735 [Acidobacteriota bacterium]
MMLRVGSDRRRPTFFEGEIVRVAHDMLRGDHGLVIACWQLRIAQRRTDGWAYFAQAVPIGVWPARFAWLPECYIVPTGIWRPVRAFLDQDRWFARAGRESQLAARRETLVLRSPLPVEAGLVARLDELRLPFRGTTPCSYGHHLRQLVN